MSEATPIMDENPCPECGHAAEPDADGRPRCGVLVLLPAGPRAPVGLIAKTVPCGCEHGAHYRRAAVNAYALNRAAPALLAAAKGAEDRLVWALGLPGWEPADSQLPWFREAIDALRAAIAQAEGER